ncbi:MAG: ABC transporter permease, partial [Spirochaetales bacterium]|nr:ABC transporter permease [Spirochaetales bacterium]
MSSGQAAERKGVAARLQQLFQVREFPIIVYILIMGIVFSLTIEGFFSFKNFENVTKQISVIGVMAIGQTLAILAAGIDLSVGSIMAFAISIGGNGIVQGWSIWAVYPYVLALGLLLGLVNGYLVTRLKVHALIITLGTMNIYRGITMVVTKGRWIVPIPSSYLAIGRGYVPFIILLVTLVVFMVVTSSTRFGRNLFAIGGSEEAAIFSGVPVRRYRVIVYVISGFLSALAGLIFV